MADEKKDAGKKEEPVWWVYLPVLVIVGVLILGSRMSGENIFGQHTGGQAAVEEEPQAPVRDIFNVYDLMGRGDLALGVSVINTERVSVRTSPAGSIVGTQKKLETGRLMEGPLNQFGTLWWRVDYPEAPDGWVEFDGLSTRIGIVRAINIVPLAYSFYKPIGYGLLFILLGAYLTFHFMLKKEEGIAEKKKKLKDEQYREAQPTLEQIIREKPDVEELPGFRTEEIVPVVQAEKNQRWSHIEDLIKSYNSSDWRQAIIEADIILEEMLEKMGYEGITIGDKLKKVERSDFVTLDKAWSAHKVRNQIAHGGSAFKLSRELAERTIKDYEEVFREFYYI